MLKIITTEDITQIAPGDNQLIINKLTGEIYFDNNGERTTTSSNDSNSHLGAIDLDTIFKSGTYSFNLNESTNIPDINSNFAAYGSSLIVMPLYFEVDNNVTDNAHQVVILSGYDSNTDTDVVYVYLRQINIYDGSVEKIPWFKIADSTDSDSENENTEIVFKTLKANIDFNNILENGIYSGIMTSTDTTNIPNSVFDGVQEDYKTANYTLLVNYDIEYGHVAQILWSYAWYSGVSGPTIFCRFGEFDPELQPISVQWTNWHQQNSLTSNFNLENGIGENSIQQINNQSGMKGYRILAQTGEEGGNGYYLLDSTEGLEMGDIYSVRVSWNAYNRGAIFAIAPTEIDGVTYNVTVVNYFDKPLKSEAAVKEQPWLNTLSILEKPELGTIDIGTGSFAEGHNTVARYVGSHAEGFGSQALGYYSHAEGQDTIALYGSHAEGRATEATGENAHAEGHTTYAIGDKSHAEGEQTYAEGLGSHAEGFLTHARGAQSHAEGHTTQANGPYSHTEGRETIAVDDTAHAEGLGSQAFGENSHAEGNATYSFGENSHAEGANTQANGKNSHAEGCYTKANGDRSHAEGYESEATGINSHAEGYSCVASETNAHAEGDNTNATKESSHSEGKNTTADGIAAHAEGNGSKATGLHSHAEGSSTASNQNSHSEGTSTASGINAHAEGNGSKASGSAAHSEGYSNTASGTNSHAEGYNNSVASTNGHVEGENNIVRDAATSAHVEGIKNTATAPYQHVQGKHSIVDEEGKYAHIVGGGDWGKPKNIHTVDWNGNAWFSGNVTVGTNKEKLATESKLDEKIESLVVTGTYIGNAVEDSLSQTINLGKTPKAVLVAISGSNVFNHEDGYQSGIAIGDMYAWDSNGISYISIVENGFKVTNMYVKTTPDSASTNTSGQHYYYIAWF